MIYAFVGSDPASKKKFLADLLKTHEDREAIYFDSESFDTAAFLNTLGSGDIFARKYFVVLRGIVAGDKHDISSKFGEMAQGETVFVILEDGLLKATLEELKRHAKVLKTVDLPKGKDDKFNIFSITDAYGARDKKITWVLMEQALRSGVTAEEILNTLIWQTKNLLFVKRETDPRKTGLSPFVYEKAKKYSANYSLPELQDISRSLTKLFHEGHLGLDVEPNLELFLLRTL